MRLGIGLPLASSAKELRGQVELAQAADRLGYSIVWAPEAYGADAVSLLATIAATTERIEIGAGILQIPGRTPAMTAMTAVGLQTLSGGRFRLGLGVSGPQVSEGWHGVRFDDPLGRTEEYVHIVRQALSRHRVTAGGKHFTLPLPDSQGKSLALAMRADNLDIPIYLAAVGPKNLALTGRIADGWLGIFVDSDTCAELITAVRAGAVAADRDPDALEICVTAPLSMGPDPSTAAAPIRPYAALYIGGMGSKKVNFYHRIATAMGYESEADEVQDRFLARDYDGAAAAVPEDFLRRTCLVGDRDDIAAGLTRLRDVGVTTVAINPVALPVDRAVDILQTVRSVGDELGIA